MSGPVEGHIEVARTARYWELGVGAGAPPGAGGESTTTAPDEVWFVLHGYRQLAERFLRRFEPLDDGKRRVVAPEALSRFYVGREPGRHGPESVVGATWMTREDRLLEIADYVRYLDALHAERAVPGARDIVLGFSQGVATAARWTTLGSVRPAALILWGDTLPPDLDVPRAAAAWTNTDIVLVRGSGDAAITPELAERERGQLASADIAYRVVEYDGGHDIDAATLVALASG